MWESVFGATGLLAIGGFVVRHLNGRINRAEDKAEDHFKSVDTKLSNQNREIGEVKAIVERIEKKLG